MNNYSFLYNLNDEQINDYVTDRVVELSKECDYDVVATSFSVYQRHKDSRQVIVEDVMDYDKFISPDVPVYPITSKFHPFFPKDCNPIYMNSMELYTDFIKYLLKRKKGFDINNSDIVVEAGFFIQSKFGVLGKNQELRNKFINSEEYINGVSISDYYCNDSAACLEKSLAFHNLLTFFGIKDHLIFSSFDEDDNLYCDGHVFNIYETGSGKSVLFDSTLSHLVKVDNKQVYFPFFKKLPNYEEVKNMDTIYVNFKDCFNEIYHNSSDLKLLKIYVDDEKSYFMKPKVSSVADLVESNITNLNKNKDNSIH